MKPENLTPEQKEAILKAVTDFLEWSGNAYVTAKEVQDVFIRYTQNEFSQNETGKYEYNGLPMHTLDVLFTAQRLNDFLFNLQEAIDLKPEALKVSLN